MLPAYLIMHAVAFGGQAQGIDAFWFPSLASCRDALPRYVAMRSKSATVTISACTHDVPNFWFGSAPS